MILQSWPPHGLVAFTEFELGRTTLAAVETYGVLLIGSNGGMILSNLERWLLAKCKMKGARHPGELLKPSLYDLGTEEWQKHLGFIWSSCHMTCVIDMCRLPTILIAISRATTSGNIRYMMIFSFWRCAKC